MNYKKIFGAIMLGLALSILTTVVSVDFDGAGVETVQAAVSKKTKKKAQEAYRKMMYESDYLYFKLIDIDKDGLKDLIVSYESNPCSIIIYTYRKGKLKCVDKQVYMSNGKWSEVGCEPVWSSMGYTYNVVSKRLHGKRGGGGSIEDWYYTFTKSGKLKCVYLQQIETSFYDGAMHYNYYYNYKKISKTKYFEICNRWNSRCKPLKMHKTSTKSIKEYIVVK